jgi:hypothetical protein
MRMHGLSASLPEHPAVLARASSLHVLVPWLTAYMPGLSPGFRLPGHRVLEPGLDVCTGRAMPVQSLMPANTEAHISPLGSPGGATPSPGLPPFKGRLTASRLRPG